MRLALCVYWNNSSSFQVIHKLQKTALEYPKWKAKHKPNDKPWLHPEQSSLPPFDPNDLITQNSDGVYEQVEVDETDAMDESNNSDTASTDSPS